MQGPGFAQMFVTRRKWKGAHALRAFFWVLALVVVFGLGPAVDVGYAAQADLAQDDPAIITDLISDLSDSNWQVRQNAAIKLADFGPAAAEAAPALVRALADASWFVPMYAAEALERIGVLALPALVDGLQAEKPDVRSTSATLIGALGSEAQDAVEPLLAAIADENATVRKRAAEALALVAPNAAELLLSLLVHDETTSGAVANIDDARGDTPHSPPVNMGAVILALDTLNVIPLDALSTLETLLHDPDVAVRRTVSQMLANIETAEATAVLMQAASDKDVTIRLTVAEALGERSERVEGVTEVLTTLTEDPNNRVRREALVSLVKLSPDLIDVDDLSQVLKKALSDGDVNVQRTAAEALHALGITHPSWVNMYHATTSVQPLRISPKGSVGVQFVANAPFDEIEVRVPTWNRSDSEITFSLYKWAGHFSTTTSGTPIASRRFVGFPDNAWLKLTFEPQPEGEYVWVLHEVEGQVGVWKSSSGFSHILAYEDGQPAGGSFMSTLHYTNHPIELFGPNSGPVDLSFPVEHLPPYAYPEDHPVRVRDVYADTWSAVDGLGRPLLSYDEVGDVREDKFVGLFYWTWHYQFAPNTVPVNVNEVIEKYPEAIYDLNHPAWGPLMHYHFWNEPLFGFYDSTDPWVLRRHAEMLADAGVDVIIFDTTNGSFTWRPSYIELFRVFSEAREQGVKTPQIAFMLGFGPTIDSKEALKKLYTDFYRAGDYHDLWFYWDGKPLIMGYPNSLNLRDPLEREIAEFFTFRPAQPSYVRGPERPDHWGWLSAYPQKKFGLKDDGTYEQVTVGVALNHSATQGLTAMNAGPDVFGRSWTVKDGPDTRPDSKLYGANFTEQWEYALEVDPDFVFITGWNEWVAMRHHEWQGVTNAFPDQFDDEYSRDIEPTKGDLKDHYYYQMISFIRQFKGVRPPLVGTGPKTIDIHSEPDSGHDQWAGVGPAYYHYEGSTMHRDYPGWAGTHYTNTTGRNNIVLSKVARDDAFIYFMVETAEELTPATDPAWMRLLITTSEADPGWEGYQFVVNRQSPGDQATLEKSTGGWNWTEVGQVDYAVKGYRLEIKIPRAWLGLEADPMEFGFKWSDNMQNDGDILDFYQYGDTAPGGRFHYRYVTDVQ